MTGTSRGRFHICPRQRVLADACRTVVSQAFLFMNEEGQTNPLPLVTYYRVSTREQGQSGLGLEAQRAAVAAYVETTHATLLHAYTQLESGKLANRPQLAFALTHCRETGAILVIAKLDRLARNVTFLSQLMDGDVEFTALDLPGIRTSPRMTS